MNNYFGAEMKLTKDHFNRRGEVILEEGTKVTVIANFLSAKGKIKVRPFHQLKTYHVYYSELEVLPTRSIAQEIPPGGWRAAA